MFLQGASKSSKDRFEERTSFESRYLLGEIVVSGPQFQIFKFPKGFEDLTKQRSEGAALQDER